ncbi:MAG: VOC family protein [Saprospiraceae bacterium]|nr:VOC family protein [Saprospiraceae bacterium]
MNRVFSTFIPEGFSTLNSYLMVTGAADYIEFLKKAFYAEELNRTVDEENSIVRNCVLKIGKSCFMVGEAKEDFPTMITSFYLFVEDPEKVYRNALKNGATDLFPPTKMDYGDLQGGVVDPAGNYWWISRRLVKEGY